MDTGAVTSSSAFNRGEDAVESFHERIGDLLFPVRQDALQMIEDHLGCTETGGPEAAPAAVIRL